MLGVGGVPGTRTSGAAVPSGLPQFRPARSAQKLRRSSRKSVGDQGSFDNSALARRSTMA